LELLRTLIIFGGRDVSVNKLTQLLWPDADGDLARRTIETTLHRLRRLIGEECILRQENQLSLNPRCCWFDVRAFEQLAEPENCSLPVVVRAERLLDLYRGPFLGDDDTPSASILRERLRAKFIRAIAQIGEKLEAETNYQAALPCYEKGIDAEPLAEELYRRLMQCYRHLHRPAEALAVYRRCHTALASMLHMEPAEGTRLLYREIQRNAS
jgi:DNA-binding SARP family transcriptional activator